jgi:SsrA-binding protein
MAPTGTKLVASNRKARHDFSVLDTVEAGMVLHGSEVKSLRTGQVQLADAYARFVGGECWLEGVHIAPYSFATGVGRVDPDRARKLLLHRDEITRLRDRVNQERLSLVPLAIYFKDGRAKVELALARGRKKEDRRHAMAERDAKAEAARALGRQRKGRVD